jgi:hypothetical protein
MTKKKDKQRSTKHVQYNTLKYSNNLQNMYNTIHRNTATIYKTCTIHWNTATIYKTWTIHWNTATIYKTCTIHWNTATPTPLKTRGELRCYWGVNSSYSTSGTHQGQVFSIVWIAFTIHGSVIYCDTVDIHVQQILGDEKVNKEIESYVHDMYKILFKSSVQNIWTGQWLKYIIMNVFLNL